ncbi:MAG TPA: helix-turn-helix domain-containing protein [Solirubrobacteraceae bacterium]|jgi:AcrR family transcriptional regulator|nr:helix-turn-helix domain-containing protein [Solirubrobacteraceae bacterium]
MTSRPAPVIPAPEARPLRADARRNRERILKAARAVFADQGIDAQIDDVARRAKVGVGTVYRHFPTKELLLDAIVREHFDVIAGMARGALDHEDGWTGFAELIWSAAERNAADRSLCEVMSARDKSDVVEECGLAAMTADLMERAKAQGTMRADAGPADVPVMMIGVSAVMQTLPGEAHWRRYVELMLDGLRAS